MRIIHNIYQSIESIWWRKSQPNILLRGLSKLYTYASKHDQKKRSQRAITPPLPLISIGNISVGGSGKTPFTIWLAQQLKRHHFNPVILCRGDGGKQTSPQLLNKHSLARDVGDEAVLMYRSGLCPVISAQDRVAASHMAKQYGDIILLDDGFQYRQLHRQCDIVLIPNDGVGNGYLLPAGPLREPTHALKRASIIVRTDSKPRSPLTNNKEWYWHTKPNSLNDWLQHHKPAPKAVFAISAIARPQRFTNSLQELGIHIEGSYFFPDHYSFTQQDILNLCSSHRTIAVTAKDAVKLLPIWPKDNPLWVLEQSFEAEEGLIEAILESLKKP